MNIDISLTWVGWVYVTLVAISVVSQILLAGKPRSPWPAGGWLLVGLTTSLTLAYLILFVGVTH